MRTIVDLPLEQIDALKQMGARSRLSRAELMRRAVAEYIARHQSDQSDNAFGLWKSHDIEGVEYQQGLRMEWGQ